MMKKMEEKRQMAMETPHFIAPMIKDFRTRLKIPNAFMKHIPQESSENASLRGPNATIWDVRLNKTDNCLYLEDGWPEFATACSLSLGEFLLFKKQSDMIFTVKIFGTNYLTRESGFDVTKSQEKVNCFLPKKLDDKSRKSDKKSNTKAAPELCSPTLTAGHEQHKLTSDVDERDTFTTVKALEAVIRFKLKLSNPSFHVPIRKSYFSNYLPIPRVFADKHFPPGIEIVTLAVSSGRMWQTWLYKENKYQYKLIKGWRHFGLDMELEVGDICVFELVDKKNVVLKTYIFKEL